MKNISYMDHSRGVWMVRYEHHGLRCEMPVRLVDGAVLEHELEHAKAKCIRKLEHFPPVVHE